MVLLSHARGPIKDVLITFVRWRSGRQMGYSIQLCVYTLIDGKTIKKELNPERLMVWNTRRLFRLETTLWCCCQKVTFPELLVNDSRKIFIYYSTIFTIHCTTGSLLLTTLQCCQVWKRFSTSGEFEPHLEIWGKLQ